MSELTFPHELGEAELSLSHGISAAELLSMMKSPVKPPTAVMVIGANDQHKQSLIEYWCEQLGHDRTSYICLGGGDLVSSVSSDLLAAPVEVLFVHVVREISCHANARSVIIDQLRKIGAGTVITIWVDSAASHFADDHLMRDLVHVADGAPLSDPVARAIRTCPPTISDGVDFVIHLKPNPCPQSERS